MKVLILAFILLVGCDSSSTNTVTEYIDRNNTVIEYIDKNNTVIEYVEVSVEAEPLSCTVQNFDSVFTGRIVYIDKTPYKRGTVKAQGSGWESYAVTDDGIFRVSVKGDTRFLFSAYSPFGDYMFYAYSTPLLVAQYEESGAYECEYDTDIFECFETDLIK